MLLINRCQVLLVDLVRVHLLEAGRGHCRTGHGGGSNRRMVMAVLRVRVVVMIVMMVVWIESCRLVVIVVVMVAIVVVVVVVVLTWVVRHGAHGERILRVLTVVQVVLVLVRMLVVMVGVIVARSSHCLLVDASRRVQARRKRLMLASVALRCCGSKRTRH